MRLHAPLDAAGRSRLTASILELERAWGERGWPAAVVESELAEPDAWVAALEREGRAEAWLAARIVLDESELMRVAVHPDHLREGLGLTLVEAWLAAAGGAGCSRVHLEVAAANAPAQSLYRALGFTVVGRRPGYYRRPPDDALLMRRELVEGPP